MSCDIFWPELKKIYFCSPKERGHFPGEQNTVKTNRESYKIRYT